MRPGASVRRREGYHGEIGSHYGWANVGKQERQQSRCWRDWEQAHSRFNCLAWLLLKRLNTEGTGIFSQSHLH